MRLPLKKLNRTAIWIATRLLRGTKPRATGPESRVVLVFPSGRGSVGDDAMALAVTTQLRARGCKRIALISVVPKQGWEDMPFLDEIIDLPRTPWAWVQCIRFLIRHDALGVIGADVLDGHYSPRRSIARLELAEIASNLGLRTTLLGFSYRANPEMSSLKTLMRVGPAVNVLSRDPSSRARVERLAGVNATQVADLAFLLAPCRDTSRFKEFSAWVEKSRAEKRFILGLNCNIQSIESSDRSLIDRLIRSHAEAMSAFILKHPEARLVLIPHDSRGTDSDEIVCQRIYDEMTQQARNATYRLEVAWTASELKAVAAELDAAITGRMHFAIACLGSGTPALGFEYQDKFSGLYEFFALAELCRPSAESLDARVLLSLMEKLLADAPSLGRTVQERLPHVQELAQRNIAALVGES